MRNLRLRLTAPARTDLHRILAISRRDFGAEAAVRYSDLIEAALDALMANAERAGVTARPDIAAEVKVYHLQRVRVRVGRVRRPRHLILFKVIEPDLLVMSRILHDAIDLADHGPFDFSTEPE